MTKLIDVILDDPFSHEMVRTHYLERGMKNFVEVPGSLLKKLPNRTLIEKKSIYIVKVDDRFPFNFLAKLSSWDWTKRRLILACENKILMRQVGKYLSKIPSFRAKNQLTGVKKETLDNWGGLGEYEIGLDHYTYKDRLDVLKELVYLWCQNSDVDRLKFDKGTKQLFYGCLIRETNKWASVKQFILIAPKHEIVRSEDDIEIVVEINLEVIEFIFDDIQMNNLDKFLSKSFLGSKKTIVKELSYYLYNKGYSARWLYSKYVEFIEELAWVYAAYRVGVYQGAINQRELQKRIEVRPGYQPLESISMKHLNRALRVVDECPYTEFMDRARVVLDCAGYIGEDELVNLILNLRKMSELNGRAKYKVK